jgi:drug/metabolite transporter (DMT)-like permease
VSNLLSQNNSESGISPPSPFFWAYVQYFFLGIFGGFIFLTLKLLRIPVSFEKEIHGNWKMCLVSVSVLVTSLIISYAYTCLSAGVVTSITMTQIGWALFYSWLFLKQSVNMLQWMYVLAIFGGATCVALSAIYSNGDNFLGSSWIAFLCCVLFGMCSPIPYLFVSKSESEQNSMIKSLVYTSWMGIYCAIFGAPIVYFTIPEASEAHIDGYALLWAYGKAGILPLLAFYGSWICGIYFSEIYGGACLTAATALIVPTIMVWDHFTGIPLTPLSGAGVAILVIFSGILQASIQSQSNKVCCKK